MLFFFNAIIKLYAATFKGFRARQTPINIYARSENYT